METIFGLLGTALSGGATGLIGVLLQRFFDYKDKLAALEVVKEQNRCSEELARIESERSLAQANAMIEIAHEERLADETEAYAALQASSYKQDSKTVMSDKMLKYAIEKTGIYFGWLLSFLLGITAVARRGIRPGMTIYLVVITYIMYSDYRSIMESAGPVITVLEIHDVMLTIVQTIVYLATTSLTWWFGVSPRRRYKNT